MTKEKLISILKEELEELEEVSKYDLRDNEGLITTGRIIAIEEILIYLKNLE